MVFQLDARIPLGFTAGYDPAVAQRNQLMRLQRDAMEGQVNEQNALRDVLQRAGGGLNADDPNKRAAAAAEIAQVGPAGYQIAAPIMSGIREQREIAGIMGGGVQPAAMPAGGGVRAEPLPAAAPAVAGGNQDGFTPAGLRVLTNAESSGNPNARPIDRETGQPRSTAFGPHQFIERTWLAFARANPNLFPGVDVNTPEGRRLALSFRSDPERSTAATQWYAQQNARALRAAGVPVNDTTLALGHQFDGPVAAHIVQVAQTQPDTPIEQVVGPAAVAANREQLSGKTAGQVVDMFARRQGGGAVTPATGAAPGAQMPAATPRMPGQPTPQQFAALMAIAPRNSEARTLVQMWAPFMRQETAQAPTITLGEGSHGPAGVYERTPGGLRFIGPAPGGAPSAPVRLGDGPAGPAGMYLPDPAAPGGYRRVADAPPATPQVVIQGEGVRARADAATLTEMQQSATQARSIISLLDRAERAVRRTPEGQGAQLLPVVGQTARALGFNVEGTAEAEVLRSITLNLATLQRVPGSGATTDMEMRLYMQAVPRLGGTREGNLALIDMGRRLAMRRIAEADIYRRHAGEPDLMERLNALPPVFTPEEINVLEQDATPTAGQAPPRGVQADPPAAPAVPALPRGVPPGSAFSPSRNMWRTPDGRLFNADGTPAR